MFPDSFQLPKVGEKVIIRPLEERDLADLYTLQSDPDIKEFVGGPISSTADEWIPRMRAILPTCGVLAVDAKAERQFAGCATLGHYLHGTDLPSNRYRE